MGAARLGPQAGRGGLQHHAHARRDRLEPLEVGPGQDAGVEVRQQAGLLQDPDRHGAHVGEGVVVAVRVEPLAGLGPAVLGPVAQGEEGLLAAHRRALAGDVEDLVGGQVHPVAALAELSGDGDEGAVVAPVAAEAGEGDEDLAGVGDDTGPPGGGEPGVPHPCGGGGEVLQVLAARLEEYGRLGRVERDAVAGPPERAAHRVFGRSVTRSGHGPSIRSGDPGVEGVTASAHRR